MNQYTRVFAPVDLDAAEFNISSMQNIITPGVMLNGVVKTDAYGHGAVPIAKAIYDHVGAYSVATMEEAVNLQDHGIDKPVYILGVTHPSAYKELIEREIRPAIFTMEQAVPLSETAVKRGKNAIIHLAVDTGMGRIGVTPDEQGADLASDIASLPGIELEGVFTHLARADEEDKKNALEQVERYRRFLELLSERNVSVKIRDVSNSAGIMDIPQAHFDMARAGISLYGLYPSDEVVNKDKLPLRPVMGLKSFVIYVKTVPEGTPIGYGGTYITERESRIATVSIGYGDGYPRSLSNKGSVIIAGKRAPIRGRVCMDQIMVDVTDIPQASVGSEVTLMGRDGDECISAEEIAAISGRFHYELLCDIGKRVPRVYYRGKEVVGTKDYFHDRYDDFVELDKKEC